MCELIVKIDSALRSIVLILGAIYIVFKLTEKKKASKKVSKHGYQTEAFDDIW